MAIALAGIAVTNNTSSGTKSATFTPAVGNLIVVLTAHTGYTGSTAPTDDQGGTYSLVTTATKNASADRMQVWIRTALVSSAVAHAISHAPGTTTGGGIWITRWSGISAIGAGAARQSAKQDNQSAATPAPAFATAALSTNATITAVFNATNPAGLTQPTNYTDRGALGYASPTTGWQLATRSSGETGTTITWGSSSGSAFCSVAVELSADLTADAAPSEAADTLSSASTVSVGASLAATEANDSLSGVAAVAVAATFAATEASDTLASDGIVAGTGLTADAAVTEATDTLSASAGVSVGASLAKTEAADTLGASATADLVGTLTSTEASDAAVGVLALEVEESAGYSKPLRKRKFVLREEDFLWTYVHGEDRNAPQEAEPVEEVEEVPEPAPAVVARAKEQGHRVSIAEIQEMARLHNEIELAKRLLATAQYAALLKLFDQMRDEEDAEILLLAL